MSEGTIEFRTATVGDLGVAANVVDVTFKDGPRITFRQDQIRDITRDPDGTMIFVLDEKSPDVSLERVPPTIFDMVRDQLQAHLAVGRVIPDPEACGWGVPGGTSETTIARDAAEALCGQAGQPLPEEGTLVVTKDTTGIACKLGAYYLMVRGPDWA